MKTKISLIVDNPARHLSDLVFHLYTRTTTFLEWSFGKG